MAELGKKQELVNIKGFELLNPSKVEQAMDKLGETATHEDILAEYDKLGGAVKKGGRKLAMGTFYDFENKQPRVIKDYDKINAEENFEDQFVLVKKPKVKKVVSSQELKAKLEKMKRIKEEKDEEPKPKKEKKAKDEE